jgi:hypothetical protein
VLRRDAVALHYPMGFRVFGYAAILSIFLLELGCAVKPSAANLWRAQLERQQRVAREAGRIGHIGNAGPALGTTLPSTSR